MKVAEYLKETRAELKHVNWPTRKQAVSYTLVVIALSVATALFLGLFDSIFAYLLRLIVAR